ncbi:MAG: energy-coupled thiamine transporter ThiT [Actinomycetia bacterium]|nr:energy-coupled thiamine transporter ThiT [Actinomycetes bacterium]
MRNARILTIVEIALSIALAVVLNLLALRLPINIAGGSVSLAMLPIAVLAMRRGMWPGALAGTIFGLLDLWMNPWIVFPFQVLLDYPAPYLLFGLGIGLIAHLYWQLAKKPEGLLTESQGDTLNRQFLGSLIIVLAMLVGGILRYATHVFSGVLFFSENAVGQNVWIYSLVYNVSYLGPSLVGSIVCALILVPILEVAVPVKRDIRKTAAAKAAPDTAIAKAAVDKATVDEASGAAADKGR